MDAQVAVQAPLIAWPPDELLPRFSIRAEAGMLLEVTINAGVDALPRRGLEMGGLLLGSCSGNEIVVAAIEAVESFYPDGPSYRMTEDELAQALARPRDDQQIVGFYRSRTDGKLEPDDQDRLMLRMLAAQESVAILLVRQTKQAAAEAMLGIANDGHIAWSEYVLPLSKWLAGMVAVPAPVVVSQPSIHAVSVRASRKRSTPALTVAVPAIAAALLLLMTLTRGDEPVTEKSTTASVDAAVRLAVNDTAPVAAVQAPVAATVPEPAVTEVLVQRSRVERNTDAERSRTMPVRPFRSPAAAPRHVAVAPAMIMPPSVAAVSVNTYGLPVVPVPVAVPPAKVSSPSAAKPGLSPAAVQFVPPVLSRQSSPVVVPPDLRRLIQHEVVLSLRVSVDAAGRVKSVTPVNRLNRTEQALARSYMSAIQTWQFDPATRNGVPAQGETILTFRVMPELTR